MDINVKPNLVVLTNGNSPIPSRPVASFDLVHFLILIKIGFYTCKAQIIFKISQKFYGLEISFPFSTYKAAEAIENVSILPLKL